MKIENNRLVGDGVTYHKSPNQSGVIVAKYLVMHFTAGSTLEGAVAWLADPAARASAHVIIGRDGGVVQMVDFNRKAWHAGQSSWGKVDGLNQCSIGIESVNVGKVTKRKDGKLISWSNQVIDSKDTTIATHKNEKTPSAWQNYTPAQLEKAHEIGRLLVKTYGLVDVLGHDDIAPGRKTDPGPLFPMADFKVAVL